MKKHIFQTLALTLALSLSSCYDDDSRVGDMSGVNVITIAAMEAQSVTSYAGQHLRLTPEVTATLDASRLAYAWYLVPPQTGYVDQDLPPEETTFRKTKIGAEATLDYEVNLPSGNYTVVCEATDPETGLSAIQSVDVTVSTEFSEGFIVLKDMGDGTTDFDMVTASALLPDLAQKLDGTAIPGTPVSQQVIYGQCYIDEQGQMNYGTHLNVFTTRGYRAYRTEDMRRSLDETTAGFEDMSATPMYHVAHTLGGVLLLAEDGVHVTSADEAGSGKFGLPVADGASKHIQCLGGLMSGLMYWNDKTHSLWDIDYNGIESLPVDYDREGIHAERHECLASGYNFVGYTETAWYLAEDHTTGTRYLYLVDGDSGTVTEIQKLPAALHLAHASMAAACGFGGTMLYCIDGGKLWAYNWNTGQEQAVELPGFDGAVTFVTNQWFKQSPVKMDELIVATTTATGYRLAFYDSCVGGVPTAKPCRTVEGKGQVQSVRYTSTTTIGGFEYTMASYFGLQHPFSD